jgi:hypothetical protein
VQKIYKPLQTVNEYQSQPRLELTLKSLSALLKEAFTKEPKGKEPVIQDQEMDLDGSESNILWDQPNIASFLVKPYWTSARQYQLEKNNHTPLIIGHNPIRVST